MNENEFYEVVSGKFSAYDLMLAHLLRKVRAQMSDDGIAAFRDDIFRQVDYYRNDDRIPVVARNELAMTIKNIWDKAEAESE